MKRYFTFLCYTFVAMVTSLSALQGAQNTECLSSDNKIDCTQNSSEHHVTKKDVDSAIMHFKTKTPGLTQDALRVWKNFKAGKSDPNYTYKYWARDVVLWLRAERNLVFDTHAKVMEVFRIMKDENLISNDSVVLLASSVWSLLIHREGIPDLQKKLEENHKKGKTTPLGKPKETNV